MSYILDALRKAEDGRQHTPSHGPSIATSAVPNAPPNVRKIAFWAALALAALALAVAIFALLGKAAPQRDTPATAAAQMAATGTPASTAIPAAAVTSPPRVASSQPMPSVGSKPPARKLNQEVIAQQPAATVATAPPRQTQARAPAQRGSVTIMQPTSNDSAPASPGVSTPSQRTAAAADALPDYENMLLDGKINLPNLRMDMHVYNKVPAKRFVFIGMKKFREGDTVSGTARIETITRDGAVIDDKGNRFLLRPD